MAAAHTRTLHLLQNRDKNSYSADDSCIARRTATHLVIMATAPCEGIHTARHTLMTDFLMLLQRDHADLERGVDELLQAVTVIEIRTTLDGIRLGLTAHVEAEDIVLAGALRGVEAPPHLESLIGHVRAAHLTQQRALSALVCTRPGTHVWKDRAHRLRELVYEHAVHEERNVLPALREIAASIYESLAGAFATERLRQLAMLQPSAPIAVPDLARAS